MGFGGGPPSRTRLDPGPPPVRPSAVLPRWRPPHTGPRAARQRGPGQLPSPDQSLWVGAGAQEWDSNQLPSDFMKRKFENCHVFSGLLSPEGWRLWVSSRDREPPPPPHLWNKPGASNRQSQGESTITFPSLLGARLSPRLLPALFGRERERASKAEPRQATADSTGAAFFGFHSW